MNLADVFTVVLVILGLLTVFVGYWLAAQALFPQRVARCAGQIGSAPVKCLLVGLAGVVPLLVAGILLGRVATNVPGKIGSVALIVATLLGALFGVAGLALKIGQGLPSARDQQEPWRRVWRGGVVLAISYGTIVLLPLTLVAGFGALLLGAARREEIAVPRDPDAS